MKNLTTLRNLNDLVDFEDNFTADELEALRTAGENTEVEILREATTGYYDVKVLGIYVPALSWYHLECMIDPTIARYVA